MCLIGGHEYHSLSGLLFHTVCYLLYSKSPQINSCIETIETIEHIEPTVLCSDEINMRNKYLIVEIKKMMQG